MKRSLVFLCFCFLCILTSQAQSAFQALTLTQQEKLKQLIKKSNSDIRSIGFHFSQTKSIDMLKEKTKSSGFMIFSAPDNLRWEYEKPSSVIFLLCKGKASMKINGKVTEGSGGMGRNFSFLSKMMMEAINGNLLHNTQDFSVAMFGNANLYKIEYTPLQRQIKSLFDKMVLYIDGHTGYAVGMSLYEKNGDLTEIEFSNPRINPTIDANTFKIVQNR